MRSYRLPSRPEPGSARLYFPERTLDFLLLFVLLGCLPLLIGATPTQDDGKAPPPPKHMGTRACKKCHMKSSIGKQ